ncbi:hypothetical protein [Streptomyces arenae]|uniref:hypothetical protein n=1 Tax=Streptomyces arenae TaxID=29301 RepID=UPI00265B6CFE|nr:hypothetical protein [Streptomyces arenae]MCG7208211.1 hypothetical protein [Streptomyces arenae]
MYGLYMPSPAGGEKVKGKKNMGLTSRRAASICAAALLVVLGAGGNVAAADDTPLKAADADPVVNTEPPQETDPADTDLVDVPADQVDVEPDVPGSGDTGSGNHPGSEYCDPSRVYTPISKGKDYHKRVGAPQANTNHGSHTAKSTFTAEVSGTVGVKVSTGLVVTTEAMIGLINSHFSVSVSTSMTAKLGNTISIPTPVNKTTHAEYGVYRLRNTGKSYIIYSNCQTSTKNTVTSYSPDYVGWYVWETSA